MHYNLFYHYFSLFLILYSNTYNFKIITLRTALLWESIWRSNNKLPQFLSIYFYEGFSKLKNVLIYYFLCLLLLPLDSILYKIVLQGLNIAWYSHTTPYHSVYAVLQLWKDWNIIVAFLLCNFIPEFTANNLFRNISFPYSWFVSLYLLTL